MPSPVPLKRPPNLAQSLWRRAGCGVRYVCLNPFFATLVTLLLIVVGGLGSIWSDDIRRAFPFTGAPEWKDSPSARIFWMASGGTCLLFFLRQRAVDREQGEARREIVEQSAELARLIRTLPPANFLSSFAQMHGQAARAAETVFGAPPVISQAQAEKGVRHLLRCVAILAQQFDGDHPDHRYAANVMLYRGGAGLSAGEVAALQPQLRFVDQGTSVGKLKGVLELIPAYSSLARDNSGGPDPAIRPLALPVPREARRNSRFMVLPGAPLAFAERAPSIYLRAGELPLWCRENGDFTADVQRQLTDYFEHPAAAIQSFVSIPLCVVGNDGLDDRGTDPVGVLNVHCDRQCLLNFENNRFGRDPVSHFVDITRPLRLILMQFLAAAPQRPPIGQPLGVQTTMSP